MDGVVTRGLNCDGWQGFFLGTNLTDWAFTVGNVGTDLQVSQRASL